MIQRIQTVFLILAAFAMAMLFALPYVEVSNDDYFVREYPIQMIFAGIIILGLIVTVFLFKNRPLQKRIIRSIMLFLLAFIGYAVYQLFLVNFNGLEFEIGGVLPIFAGYFASRASAKISADEKLVKSVDRLR